MLIENRQRFKCRQEGEENVSLDLSQLERELKTFLTNVNLMSEHIIRDYNWKSVEMFSPRVSIDRNIFSFIEQPNIYIYVFEKKKILLKSIQLGQHATHFPNTHKFSFSPTLIKKKYKEEENFFELCA